VQVDDGTAQDTQEIVITINGSNDAPVLSVETGDITTASLTEANATLSISDTVTVIDVDLTDLVTSSVVSVVENTVQVDDGTAQDTQEIVITIGVSNDAPVITSNGGGATASIFVDENQASVTTVTAMDVDVGDSQTYSLSGGAEQTELTINASTGILTFNVAPDFENKNTYEVQVTVTDNEGLTAIQSLTINVLDVNEMPIAQPDTLYTSNIRTFTIDPLASLFANDADPEKDKLTLVGFDQPQHGSLTMTAQGKMEYQPDIDFVGLDSFVYYVQDSAGNQVSATVLLDIQWENGETTDPKELTLGAALPTVGVDQAFSIENLSVVAEPTLEVKSVVSASVTRVQVDEDTIDSPDETPVENVDQTQSPSVVQEIFTDTNIVISIQSIESLDHHPLSIRASASDISGLLTTILEHDIDHLQSVFEKSFNESTRPVQLRDAIMLLRDQVDQMMDQPAPSHPLLTSAPVIISSALTAGVVTWVLRSGLLISATLASTPLWRQLDPVPILAQIENDDSQWDEDDTGNEPGFSGRAANDSDYRNSQNG